MAKSERLGSMKPRLTILYLLIFEIALPVDRDKVINLTEALVGLLQGLGDLDTVHGILDGLSLVANMVVVTVEVNHGRGFWVLGVSDDGGLTSSFLESGVGGLNVKLVCKMERCSQRSDEC